MRHLLHREGLHKGVRERAIGMIVARGLALHVYGPRVVGSVAAKKHGAVSQNHARPDGHAEAHGICAAHALAVDDAALRAARNAHAQLCAVDFDVPIIGPVNDLVVECGAEQVFVKAPAVGAGLALLENHRLEIHAHATHRADHALAYARVDVGDVVTRLVIVVVERFDLKVVAWLKRESVKDTRLLFNDKVTLPCVAVHGIRVDESPVPQAVVHCIFTHVVVDQLGRREKACHGHVVWRLVRHLGCLAREVKLG